MAAKIDHMKPMFSAEPLVHTIELDTKYNNPYAQARLYATDEARQLGKMMVHGFRSKILPDGALTNA
jgi:hypothetical protein